MTLRRLLALPLLVIAAPLAAQGSNPLAAEIDRRATAVNEKVVAWRRDIHQHPELSYQEERTAALAAAHLRALGMEVRTGVGGHGVVGVLRGGRPGRVVALRADMDALPVTEENDLPFRSRVRTTVNGQEVGVMHACGHDTHVAMLMGAAEVLAGMRERIAGTVVFIFQPAEEASGSADGGALAMINDGALQNPAPNAIFGLHVFAGSHVGNVFTRPGGIMASSDGINIVVHGRQTHGALPWNGVDPIVTASQIVLGLQTVVSRQVDLTLTPAIVTIGTINGGVRSNIIPDSVVLTGTIRTFDTDTRAQIHRRVRETAQHIASAAGARADVTITSGNPVTNNDPALTDRMGPTIQRVAGAGRFQTAQLTTTAEDFSRFQERIPGVFIFLGATPANVPAEQAAPNHSPHFIVDEGVLPLGVRLLANLATDYLRNTP